MSEKSKLTKGFRRLTWSQRIQVLKETFSGFIFEKGLFHGAALSYYTIFAMVPIIYLSIMTFGSVIGQKTMIEIITKLLKEQVGIQDVSGIITFLETVDFEKGNFILQVTGIVALLLSSTAILNSLRNSINTFFEIERKFDSKRKQFISSLLAKLVSIGLLGLIGAIVIITYFSQIILFSFSQKLFGNLLGFEAFMLAFLKFSIAILSNMLIFVFVFKFLHDGKVQWGQAWMGSFFTSILLYFGQVFIQYYLTHFFFAKDGGIAGVFLVILAYVYYSSQMIFIGAKFTSVYANISGNPIKLK
jgi:membrane protein